MRQALFVLLLAGCLLAGGGRLGAGSSLLGWALEAPPRAAPESQEEGPGELFKVINFIILAGVLGFLLRKPMKDFFVQRSATIQRELEEGRKALESSEAQLRAMEEKLRRLGEEISALRASAARETDAERQRLRQEAAQEAERILESARVRLEAENRSARLELKIFAAQEALKLAEQMIRERLDDPTRRELVRQFIASLETQERRN